MADLLAALAPPTVAVPGSFGRDVVGIDPITLTLLAKGAGEGVKAGMKWLRTPEGQRFVRKLKDTEEDAERRRVQFQRKADRAKDPEVRARWQHRADRERRKVDDVRVSKMLADKGIVQPGPVLEYKRNLLSLEWDGATPERQKEIEAEVARMDARLAQLHREQALLVRTTAPAPVPAPASASAPAPASTGATGQARFDGRFGAASSEPPREEVTGGLTWGKKRLKLAPMPNVERALVKADKMLVSGMGGNRWAVQAPPGSGRLVRIPFYPENNAYSWSGPDGIEFSNDDPVTKLVIDVTKNPRIAKSLLLRTERFDYGSYRILGFQVNEQGNSRPILGFAGGLLNLGAIVISFTNLQLYNGQTLFLQDQSMWSATFDIFNGGFSTDSPGGIPNSARIQLPGVYERRRNRWFVGLRDYPIVTGTTFVSVQVSAFSMFPATVEAPQWEIPVTCNLIAEMVEDKVFGNVVNPTPASRGGATVKVAAHETGPNEQGQTRMELVASRYRSLDTEDE